MAVKQYVEALIKKYKPFAVEVRWNKENDLWEVWATKNEGGDVHHLAESGSLPKALRLASERPVGDSWKADE